MRTLRAIFVLMHLVAVSWLALPKVASTPDDFENPRVQAWVAKWTERLGWLGSERNEQEVADVALTVAEFYTGCRTRGLQWLAPYITVAGMHQSWGMFGHLTDTPARLEIRGLVDGEWMAVYVARSVEHRWRHSMMDHERMRTFVNQFSWKRNRPKFNRFATWIAEEVASDLEGVEAVRVQMRTILLPDAGVLRESRVIPTGKVFWQRVVRMDDEGG